MQLETINKQIDRRLEILDEIFASQFRCLCEAKAVIEEISFLKYLKEKIK